MSGTTNHLQKQVMPHHSFPLPSSPSSSSTCSSFSLPSTTTSAKTPLIRRGIVVPVGDCCCRHFGGGRRLWLPLAFSAFCLLLVFAVGQLVFLHCRLLLPFRSSSTTTPAGAISAASAIFPPPMMMMQMTNDSSNGMAPSNSSDHQPNHTMPTNDVSLLLHFPSASASSSSSSSSSKLFVQQQQHRHLLPTCLIIGVRKGGTRALLDALELHPKIRVARHEVHFFDNERNYAMGPDWYRSQMPLVSAAIDSNEVVIVEKTPAYFTANQKVPKRVFQLNPDMKMIVIVREPVTRTISDFTQIEQTKRERHKPAVDFQRMSFINVTTTNQPNDVLNSISGSTLELNTRFKPIRNSLYADHFARWLQFFPLHQLLVLDGDKFITDPLSQLRRVERFLGLETLIQPWQLVFYPRKGFFCFRSTKEEPIRCLGPSKGRKQTNITADIRQLLANKFKPYNQRFFAQLNRQFPGWEH